MRIHEIIGKEIKEIIGCINLKVISDEYFGQIVRSAIRDIETRPEQTQSEVIASMYGLEIDEYGENLEIAQARADLSATKARTAKDLAKATEDLSKQ